MTIETGAYQFVSGPLRVELTTSSYRKMAQIARMNSPDEIGGVLIGYYSENRRSVVITDIISSILKKDMRSIIIDGEETTRQLTNIEHESEGRQRAVGYWHTHPSTSEAPSWQDTYAMWEDPYPFPSDPVLIILGRAFDITEISITIYQREKYNMVRLHLENFSRLKSMISYR